MTFIISIFCKIDWDLLSNIANCGLLLLGIISACYIYIQIRQTKKISGIDLILKLNANLFTEKSLKIFFLIENDLLIFNNSTNYSYFEIDKNKIVSYPNIYKYLQSYNICDYTTTEIDFFILNPLEDIGIIKETKFLYYKHIVENYSYYIIKTWENTSIINYIKDIRNEDEELYTKLEMLYNKIRK